MGPTKAQRQRQRNSQGPTYHPSFLCPLSLKIMENPVMDGCAHTFERDAILGWLEQHSYCPISRKPLTEDDLVPNHNLTDRIEKWKWQNGLSKHEDDESFQQLEIGTASSNTTSSNDLEVDGIKRSMTERTGRKSSRRLLGRKDYQMVDQSLVLLPQERRALELAENQAIQAQSMATKRKFWICVQSILTALVVSAACLTILWFYKVSRHAK